MKQSWDTICVLLTDSFVSFSLRRKLDYVPWQLFWWLSRGIGVPWPCSGIGFSRKPLGDKDPLPEEEDDWLPEVEPMDSGRGSDVSLWCLGVVRFGDFNSSVSVTKKCGWKTKFQRNIFKEHIHGQDNDSLLYTVYGHTVQSQHSIFYKYLFSRDLDRVL